MPTYLDGEAITQNVFSYTTHTTPIVNPKVVPQLNENYAILKKCVEIPNHGMNRIILGNVNLSSQP